VLLLLLLQIWGEFSEPEHIRLEKRMFECAMDQKENGMPVPAFPPAVDQVLLCVDHVRSDRLSLHCSLSMSMFIFMFMSSFMHVLMFGIVAT
jgi:hypothetical protein